MLWINVVVWFLDSHDYSTLYFILTPGLLVGSVLLTFLIFFSSPIICLYVLSSTLWYPLRFPHENDVRFVLTSNCLYENSCLIYLICVCLRIVVSKTYCVVFLFCLSSSCLPYVARFSGLSIFDCPFGILSHLFTQTYLRCMFYLTTCRLCLDVGCIFSSEYSNTNLANSKWRNLMLTAWLKFLT